LYGEPLAPLITLLALVSAFVVGLVVQAYRDTADRDQAQAAMAFWQGAWRVENAANQRLAARARHLEQYARQVTGQHLQIIAVDYRRAER
jgi:hypothetical protein